MTSMDKIYVRINANTRNAIQALKDAGSIESTARIVELHEAVSHALVRAASDPVEPDGADVPTLPIPATVRLSDAERDYAVQVWDETMPDYKGLLDATPYDPDEEKEDS